jgi:hypothetical protein
MVTAEALAMTTPWIRDDALPDPERWRNERAS